MYRIRKAGFLLFSGRRNPTSFLGGLLLHAPASPRSSRCWGLTDAHALPRGRYMVDLVNRPIDLTGSYLQAERSQFLGGTVACPCTVQKRRAAGHGRPFVGGAGMPCARARFLGMSSCNRQQGRPPTLPEDCPLC